MMPGYFWASSYQIDFFPGQITCTFFSCNKLLPVGSLPTYLKFQTYFLKATNGEQSIVYTLSSRIGKVVASHAEGRRVDSRQRLHRFILCTSRSGSSAMRVGGATSQINLPSLMPLSVAGCGRLQLGVTSTGEIFNKMFTNVPILGGGKEYC